MAFSNEIYQCRKKYIYFVSLAGMLNICSTLTFGSRTQRSDLASCYYLESFLYLRNNMVSVAPESAYIFQSQQTRSFIKLVLIAFSSNSLAS